MSFTLPKMTEKLNSQQEIAVRAPQKPLLIVAGAGTGKTRTLTSRLKHLIESGVPAGHVCAITFTNKAAREMARRVEFDEAAGSGPFIGTFHSLGARILRSEARFVGRTAHFTIFDDHDSFALVKRLLKRLDEGERPAPHRAANAGPAAFRDLISAVKSGILNRTEIKTHPLGSLALEMFSSYERELRKQNAFDFDDLIEKPVRIFRAHPGVLRMYHRRLRHLLIDEYQDLNLMQYELVRLLAGPAAQLSVVGDDHQTIYSWRGSDVSIFLNFERDWPEASVILLEENYRSSGNIIAAASALIKNNRDQKPKNLWTKNLPGPPITLLETADEESEAEWIARDIGTLKNENGAASVAVLYRTNAQSRAIEQALLAHEISYRIYGGLKFYERREIKDIIAALRIIRNPKDAVSGERLEKTFRKSVWRELGPRLKEMDPALPPAALIESFLKASDYLAYMEQNLSNPAERRENIGELIVFAAGFRELTPLLEQVALLQASDRVGRDNAEGRPVELMTIHLAKGLEFDAVFIAGCTEGLLPHARSQKSRAELEEERRLMYVAMTRAKRDLAISFYDLPSRFLSELPQELLKFQSLVSDETEFSDSEERYITLD